MPKKGLAEPHSFIPKVKSQSPKSPTVSKAQQHGKRTKSKKTFFWSIATPPFYMSLNQEKFLSVVVARLLKIDFKDRSGLMLANRKISKKYGISLLKNAEIVKAYRQMVENGEINPLPGLEALIRKRSVRTLSGVAPVAVLTMPYACPGKCAYCPTEKDVPQSYLKNEPAVMRAIRCGYDPFRQVQDRLRALVNNGHEPEKIELIVIGGTWSVLPVAYRYWYIMQCFKAANEFKTADSRQQTADSRKKISNIQYPIFRLKRELAREQTRNENAKYRLVGITVETRPDHINEKELWFMRELGVTRVELGVQAVDDKILKLNRRGHGVKEIADATKLLKDFGFKVTYHIMPGLPGSTPAKDLKMFKQLFADERFQPDQIKFYPTVVTKGSLLYRWWKAGKYKPYTDKQLRYLIIKCKAAVPEYVRIIRLIRDIPGESIVAGNKVTNLRQELQSAGVKCRCIRCREPKQLTRVMGYELWVISYRASEGVEYFISAGSKDRKTLYGFCRLRLVVSPWSAAQRSDRVSLITDNRGASGSYRSLRSLQDDIIKTAFVRELHVYGELVPVGKDSSASSGRKRAVQHAGLGKRLLKEAERIARANGCGRIAVIAGIGVRGYYRKLGYRLENTYMVKGLK